MSEAEKDTRVETRLELKNTDAEGYPVRSKADLEASESALCADLAARQDALTAALEERDEARLRDMPLRDPPDEAHDLRQRLKRAIRWLRDAEDMARLGKPAWPTADRIRDIYEQITDDVLNGKTSRPQMKVRAEQAEAALAEALDVIAGIVLPVERLRSHQEQIDGRLAREDAAVFLGKHGRIPV